MVGRKPSAAVAARRPSWRRQHAGGSAARACNLRGTHVELALIGTTLPARFPGRHARCRHARSRHARCRHARCRHARSRHARCRHAWCRHARCRHARCRHAWSGHARCRHARCRHAWCRHAWCRHAWCRHARCRHARCRHARCRHARCRDTWGGNAIDDGHGVPEAGGESLDAGHPQFKLIKPGQFLLGLLVDNLSPPSDRVKRTFAGPPSPQGMNIIRNARNTMAWVFAVRYVIPSGPAHGI